MEGPLERGVLVAWVLEFEESEGQAVYEDDHVRAAVLALFDDCELVERQPLVVVWVVEVKEPSQGVANRSVGVAILDGHALGDELVDSQVLGEGVLRLGPKDLGHDSVHRFLGKVAVDAGDGVVEPLGQDDFVPARALLGVATGSDVRSVEGVVAEGSEDIEGRVLDNGFVDTGHEASTSSAAAGTRIRPERSAGRRVSRSISRFLDSRARL